VVAVVAGLVDGPAAPAAPINFAAPTAYRDTSTNPGLRALETSASVTPACVVARVEAPARLDCPRTNTSPTANTITPHATTVPTRDRLTGGRSAPTGGTSTLGIAVPGNAYGIPD
jgi:hypothetical protein